LNQCVIGSPYRFSIAGKRASRLGSRFAMFRP
jgi:hypothetical protein